MPNELNNSEEYSKVDKLSDTVYSLGLKYELKMNVSLSKIGNDKRYHFHKEFEYPSRSSDIDSLVTIKRSFDYYMSIESTQKTETGNKSFIRIGPTEYYAVKRGLDEVISWFNDKKYKNLFAKRDGEIILTSPVPEYVIRGLPLNKYILLTPIIIDKGMANEDKIPGVRMYLGSDEEINDMTLERFMGLYYIFSCFNMYQSALEMINYLGRPEFGFNRYTIGVNSPNNISVTNIPKTRKNGVEGRFITPKKSKKGLEELEG